MRGKRKPGPRLGRVPPIYLGFILGMIKIAWQQKRESMEVSSWSFGAELTELSYEFANKDSPYIREDGDDYQIY